MTIARWIVEQVKGALFSGRLHPGDFLGTELDLAKKFHVSRLAARDALRTLEASGVVTIRQGAGGGARIAHGNPARFAEALTIQLKLIGVSESEIFSAQHAIEVRAAEEAARNAKTADLQRLATLLEEATALRQDIPAFTKSCFAFHAALTEASYNRALIAFRKSIDEVLPEAYDATPSPEMIESILRHHRDILKLIEAKDAKRAADRMKVHLDEMWQGPLAAAAERRARLRKRRAQQSERGQAF